MGIHLAYQRSQEDIASFRGTHPTATRMALHRAMSKTVPAFRREAKAVSESSRWNDGTGAYARSLGIKTRKHKTRLMVYSIVGARRNYYEYNSTDSGGVIKKRAFLQKTSKGKFRLKRKIRAIAKKKQKRLVSQRFLRKPMNYAHLLEFPFLHWRSGKLVSGTRTRPSRQVLTPAINSQKGSFNNNLKTFYDQELQRILTAKPRKR